MRKRILTWFGLLVLATSAGADTTTPAAKENKLISIGYQHGLYSLELKQQRPLNIYLPPGYHEGEQRYPVLYLLDGGVQQDYLHIAGIASLAADFRNIREFIVIGIESLDRYHELLPATSVTGEQQRWPSHGGAAEFRRFLANEVLPYVKRQFRVTDESVLMGESFAGLFVAETMLKQPELFHSYVAISPSLWWNGEQLSKEAAALLKPQQLHGKRLYMALADEGGEMETAVVRLADTVRQKAPADFWWQYVPMPHEQHGTILHPAALDAVRKLFAYPSKTQAP